ncbi:hypothetical protein BRARA_D02672 [Brassica rapa]|uniref:Uncharacterized protein n=1 Tax=Brassica campestris TaxID=3711 RepID=A0A397ZPQ9_BRACM|nr:hypothetical protein BRARA_D02672 [Brassica rapa]
MVCSALRRGCQYWITHHCQRRCLFFPSETDLNGCQYWITDKIGFHRFRLAKSLTSSVITVRAVVCFLHPKLICAFSRCNKDATAIFHGRL